MRPRTLWCIADKNNRFIHETLKTTKEDCIWSLFDCMPEDFRTKYWKDLEGSRAAYRSLGFKPVRVSIVREEDLRLLRG